MYRRTPIVGGLGEPRCVARDRTKYWAGEASSAVVLPGRARHVECLALPKQLGASTSRHGVETREMVLPGNRLAEK